MSTLTDEKGRNWPAMRRVVPPDEEARWRAYQAWLRRKRAGTAAAGEAAPADVAEASPASRRRIAGRPGAAAAAGALALAFASGVVIALIVLRPREPPARPAPVATAPAMAAHAGAPEPARSPPPAAARGLAPEAPADPIDAMITVRNFYDDLGEGRFARAALLLAPERRKAERRSARDLAGVRAALAHTLRVESIEPEGRRRLLVRYAFVARDGAYCSGAARVETVARGDRTVISRIRPLEAC
jgi:hypothetical protein